MEKNHVSDLIKIKVPYKLYNTVQYVTNFKYLLYSLTWIKFDPFQDNHRLLHLNVFFLEDYKIVKRNFQTTKLFFFLEPTFTFEIMYEACNQIEAVITLRVS